MTLQAIDGWDEKTGRTLLADGKVSVIQSSDNVRADVEAGYSLSLAFEANVPAGATIVSVRVHVEHHEEQGFPSTGLGWQVGGGSLTGPTVLGTTSPAVLSGERNEATVAWDVTSWIDTSTKANELRFVVRNDAKNAKKTRLDQTWVVVEYVAP